MWLHVASYPAHVMTCGSMFTDGNSHVKPLGLRVKPMLRLHVALYIAEGPGRQAGGHWRENQKTFHT